MHTAADVHTVLKHSPIGGGVEESLGHPVVCRPAFAVSGQKRVREHPLSCRPQKGRNNERTHLQAA